MQGSHGALEALEEYYSRIQNSYAKLTVMHFALLSADRTDPADHGPHGTEPSIEAEHDSRLEEKEVDDIHTGEMAGLGAKWEADAEIEEQRLLAARTAFMRLSYELNSLAGQEKRLAALREDLSAANRRTRRLEDARARLSALKQRRQRVAERRERLTQQKTHNTESRASQEKLRQDLTTAREDQLQVVADEEKAASKMDIVIQLLA